MLSKTQFPDVNILHLAFFGPLIGALARSAGGMISDKLGGVRVTQGAVRVGAIVGLGSTQWRVIAQG